MANRWTIGPEFVEHSSKHHLNHELFSCVKLACGSLPPGWSLEFTSGVREGDKRYHGRGMALDVQLIDEHGARLPNYQDVASFRAYEKFAQEVKRQQVRHHRHLPLRWGGYFSGPKSRYGALDLMHFDVGKIGTAGGDWEHGLTAAQKGLWPGAVSEGMKLAPARITKRRRRRKRRRR